MAEMMDAKRVVAKVAWRVEMTVALMAEMMAD